WRTWMRLGIALAILYVSVDLAPLVNPRLAPVAHELAEPAHLGLTHVMATFACATFMRVGAARARFAPAYFLSGGALLFLSRLLLLAGLWGLAFPLQSVGAGLLLVGWFALAWAAAEVDNGRPAGPTAKS
ncbi:MAG: hypothetical protein KAG62_14035, partial [Caulobacter sp.]|nr:hypothetical protein [Caulobacter sp.]